MRAAYAWRTCLEQALCGPVGATTHTARTASGNSAACMWQRAAWRICAAPSQTASSPSTARCSSQGIFPLTAAHPARRDSRFIELHSKRRLLALYQQMMQASCCEVDMMYKRETLYLARLSRVPGMQFSSCSADVRLPCLRPMISFVACRLDSSLILSSQDLTMMQCSVGPLKEEYLQRLEDLHLITSLQNMLADCALLGIVWFFLRHMPGFLSDD